MCCPQLVFKINAEKTEGFWGFLYSCSNIVERGERVLAGVQEGVYKKQLNQKDFKRRKADANYWTRQGERSTFSSV